MRTFIGILLLTTGCVPPRSGLDVPTTVTAVMEEEQECSEEFPDWTGDGLCDEWDIFFHVQHPDGSYGYLYREWAVDLMYGDFAPPKGHIAYLPDDGVLEAKAHFAASYRQIRDHQIDCEGNLRTEEEPAVGSTMTTSFIVTAVSITGMSLSALGIPITWDAWLWNGNPAKQAVTPIPLDADRLCLSVSSKRFGMGYEQSAGVPEYGESE